jgi:protein-S-isoprenylcysteine O-methyltransferase Ste14
MGHDKTLELGSADNPFRIMPPRVVMLLLVAATVVHLVLRLPVRSLSVPLGVVLVCLGLVLNIWADALFRRAHTPVRPGERPERLIAQGPFRVTRNPMYLGMIVSLVGIAVLTGSWPFWAAPALLFLVVSRYYIPFEESQMQGRFGRDYADYRRRVRRWV